MTREEFLTPSEGVKIDTKAIASVARLATLEIEGVKTVAEDFKAHLYKVLGRDNQSGIRITITKNREVYVKIPLVIKYGYSIPEIAGKVQENVYQSMERIAGIAVKDIDINVVGVEQ